VELGKVLRRGGKDMGSLRVKSQYFGAHIRKLFFN
jgi:hypothetical protein